MREGWTYKKLGEVCEVVSGSTPKTNVPEFWGNGHYWITPAEIDDATVYINKTERQITDAAIDKTHLQLLPIGTVLLSSRAPIGKVAITDTEMYCNQGFKNCICSDAIYNKFLFYFLKYKKNYLNSLGRGATFKEISKSIVEKVAIPLPPLSEQQSIVAELDKINELISLKKAQLSDLDSLAQSIFYDMFGDPIVNEKGWEVKKLGEVTEPTIGLTYKPDNVTSDGTGTIVLRSSNIQDSKLDFEDVVRVNMLIKDNKYVKDGDILMCSRNGSFRLVGKVAMIHALSERMSYGAFMTIIRSEYNPYLFGYFKTSAFREYLIQGKTTTVNQITVQMLKEIKLPIPPLSLQQEFAKRIELIEQQKAQISSTIKDLETLLASRMQYWFD